jgi:hypothetical protein
MPNRRKAVAADGDDLTFTRYLRTGDRTQTPVRQILVPADTRGTLFKGRVLQPKTMQKLLVSGHSNIKLGRDVRQGKLKGYWIFSLSLEERATCPRSCSHWRDCYGNHMHLAKRVDHTAPDFLPALERELAYLCTVKPYHMRNGVLVRLHALGDFYSTDYVAFWDRMLREHSTLAVFGYTARRPNSKIGRAVMELIDKHPGRAMMRFSDGKLRTRSTVSIKRVEDCPPGAFVCPEQTGQFEACGKCGACWSTLKNVAFVDH